MDIHHDLMTPREGEMKIDHDKVSLMTQVDSLRRGWQACEAERDAAKAEAEDRRTMAARAQEALRYVMNGLPTNDAVWAAYGNADSARAWLAERDAKHQADLDLARAGEARAVEAIKALLNELHEFDFEIDGSVEFFDSVQQCRDAIDSAQPDLDWLAQQRREAVLAWLDAQVDNGERADIGPWCRERADALRAGEGVQDAE
jgi:hypothetical protein